MRCRARASLCGAARSTRSSERTAPGRARWLAFSPASLPPTRRESPLTGRLSTSAVFTTRSGSASGSSTSSTCARPGETLPIFAPLPGAGAATVPNLIAAFGARRDRFQSAYQVQCYSGIAPVEKASGKTCVIAFRSACPSFSGKPSTSLPASRFASLPGRKLSTSRSAIAACPTIPPSAPSSATSHPYAAAVLSSAPPSAIHQHQPEFRRRLPKNSAATLLDGTTQKAPRLRVNYYALERPSARRCSAGSSSPTY